MWCLQRVRCYQCCRLVRLILSLYLVTFDLLEQVPPVRETVRSTCICHIYQLSN